MRSLGGDGGGGVSGGGGSGAVAARPGRRGLSEECRASLAVPSTEEAASGEAPPSAPAPPSLPPPSAPPAFPALALELENADEPEEAVVQNSVISSEVNALNLTLTLTLTLTLGLSRILTQALTLTPTRSTPTAPRAT